MSGSWIYLLSQKYNHFTFGTTGKYNFALIAPNSKGQPMSYAGIIKPVNETAVSVWEDPSYLIVSEYEPFHSLANMKHLIYNFLKNLNMIIFNCQKSSYFSIAIIVIAMLFIKIDNSIFSNKIFFAYFTVFIYCFGYAIILVEFRYLYIVYLLITLIGVLILKNIFPYRKQKTNIISVLFFISIILISIFYPVKQFFKHIDINKDIHIISNIIQKEISANSNVASNKEWSKTLYISYLNGYQYYGKTKEENFNNSLMKDLRNNNIEYYFDWKNDTSNNKDYKIANTEKSIKILNGKMVILDIIHIK